MGVSINQSIKTHFYSAICRERIRGGEGLAPVVGLLSPGQNGAGNVRLAASVRQNDTRRSYSRYPTLREAGTLATVVSLAHIGGLAQVTWV